MPKPASDFLAILRCLAQHKVDFIVVGGVCAVLHGAPVTTFDLDIVHLRAEDNLQQLLSALKELDAYYRGRSGQRLRPRMSDLASPGHQLLMTNAGPLDLLGAIGNKLSYEDLLPNTVALKISGLRLRILNLETLIAIKEFVGRDKDKATTAILRQTLKEKRKR